MSANTRRHISIGWLMSAGGSHRAAWQLQKDRPDPVTDFNYHRQMAQEAENAKLDYIFHADWPSVRPGAVEETARNVVYNNHMEPISWMSAMAAVTSKIGIVATGSTSYMEPYNLARQFATMDQISAGRAAWNIVTTRSTIAAFNYGRTEDLPHAERYRRAHEFVDVVMGLWDSYDDDAFIRDPVSGYYFDPKKRHDLNHEGKYLRVRGPMGLARSPQGQPVRFQAGASADGIDLAARFGELVFCNFGDIDMMLNHYRTVKEKAVAYGRQPDDLKIATGFDVIVKETESEAQEAFEQLQSLLHPDAIREVVANDIEADISNLGLHDLVTLDRLPADANSSKSGDKILRGLLAKRPMTVRELFDRFSRSRDALSIYGSPKQIADKMQEWFEAGAVDGFMLFQPLESGMRDFGSLVIPELQRRGLFRTEYEGTTLREHLGLKRPESRYKRDARLGE